MLNKTLPDKSLNTSPALEPLTNSAKGASDPKVKSQDKTSHASEWSMSLQSLLGTVVIAVFVITFIVQAFQIPSESMENTLLIGDYLLVDKFCYGGSTFWDHFLPYKSIRR